VRLFVLMFVLASAGCRTVSFTLAGLPAGSGVPEPDGIAWWTSATAECRAATIFSAEIKINGKVGTEGLRGKLRGAVTRAGEIRLEAPAPLGAPIFMLAGRADRATLTIPRDERVLIAPAADIVEALIGVRLAPSDWLDVLSGCVTSARPERAERVGAAVIAAMPGQTERVLLRNDATGWRVIAGERPGLFVEYRQFDGNWPREAAVASRPGAPVAVALKLSIAQVFVNQALPARAFELAVPAGYAPMTLDELRAAGPLGERGGAVPKGTIVR
jgi:hypothetical protein